MADDILKALDAVLQARRADGDPESSYVAKLHAAGINKILEKVGEEATEVILAAKDANTDRDAVIAETADLWFHTMVMLSHLDLEHSAVLQELARRFGLSGLDEKAARDK